MGVGNADARLQVRHEGSDYRRVEVITGRRQRRSWTAGEKAAMVAASAEPGANISEVARRFGVNRGLLAGWRREGGRIDMELDGARLVITGDVDPVLAAAVVEALSETARSGRR